MPTRWRASTRAWTCRNTTDEAAFAKPGTRLESRDLPGLSGSTHHASVEGVPRPTRRQPRGRHHPFHRQVDPDFPAHHAQRYAAAEAHGFALAGALPAHAGPVRVLLRNAASDHIRLAGQVL